jgi:uncharacterized membrane protein
MPRRARRILATLVAVSALFTTPISVIRADGSGSIAGHVEVSPLLVTLTMSAGESVVGRPIRADVVVMNAGPAQVSNIIVELRSASDGLRIKKSTRQTISKLKPGQGSSVSYTVCGRTPGNYVLLARATLNGLSVDSPARLLTIAPGNERGC